MPDYRIESDDQGITIKLQGVADRQDELTQAFQECQAGQCTCPTDEYEKLDGMQLSATDDEITLRLQAKKGEQFDTGEISACLDYTIAKAAKP